MARRRRGLSEDILLLLVPLLAGAASLALAVTLCIVVTVVVVGKPVTAVLGVTAPPDGSATARPPVAAAPTPGPEPTRRPTAPSDTTPPRQVTGLEALPGGGSGEIVLTWDFVDEPDVRYDIYRLVPAHEPFEFVGSTRHPEFIDIGVSDQQCYAVRAVDSAGNEGPFSNEACAAPPGPPPETPDGTPPEQVTGLEAFPGGGSGEIVLTWDLVDEPDVRYDIYRLVLAHEPFEFVRSTRHPEFIDMGVSDQQCYVVRAVDSAGNEGPFSNKACSPPPDTPTPTPTPAIVG